MLDVVAAPRARARHRPLARDEIFAVVDAAVAAGVETSSSRIRSSPRRTSRSTTRSALAERGALLERCFTTPYTGKCAWEHVVEGSARPAPSATCLSTDLGQPANPPVEDGLALFADRLLEAGFTDEEIRTMTVVNTRRLAGAA